MHPPRCQPVVAGLCTLALVLSAACGRMPLPEPATPAGPALVVSDRLLFGRDIPGGGTVSDSAWNAFLEEAVTPRLPAGYSVTRAEGQWRAADGAIVREAAFALEVHHPPGIPPDSVFEAIAVEYCRRFRQEAVLRVRAAAEQWLYRAPPRRPQPGALPNQAFLLRGRRLRSEALAWRLALQVGMMHAQ